MSTFSYLIILFSSYSFIGWLIEIIVVLKNSKKFSNRGFLFGPIIPLYGFGALSILAVYNLIDKRMHSVFVLILISILVTSALELFTGLLLEKTFKARWWDYRDKKFNFMGYISLWTSFGWGFFAYLLVEYVNPIISLFIIEINEDLRLFIATFLLSYLIMDFIKSTNSIIDLKRVIEKYSTFDKLKAYLTLRPDRIRIFRTKFSHLPKFKIYPNLHLDIRKIIENSHNRVEKVVEKIRQK